MTGKSSFFSFSCAETGRERRRIKDSDLSTKKALSRDPIVRLQIIQLREGRRVAKYSVILALAGGEGYTPPLTTFTRKEGKMAALQEVTDTDFATEVLEGGPAAVKLWAEW